MICDTTYTARGDVDPRVAELREVAAEGGVKIHLSLDMIGVILWYEDMGYVLDLQTGIAFSVTEEDGRGVQATPSGMAVTHLLTPPSEREVEQTLEGVFSRLDDGDLQAAIEDADRDICFYDYDDGSIEDDHDWIRRGC